MKAQQECLSADALASYLWAQLSDADAERLEQHLTGCQACLDRMRSLEAGDPFFVAAQAAAAQGHTLLNAGEIAALKEKVLALKAAATRSDCPEQETQAPEGVPHGEPLPLDFLAPPQEAGELGRLGGYRIKSVLGSGGMGMVFLAEDPQLGRPVALKVMLPSRDSGPSGRQRFLREARAAAAVVHDHVVTIHQVGEDRGIPFLAMQFLDGESLEDRLRREGRLPMAKVLRIGCEVALGLAAAHKRDLIHRDIKPANLWLEDLASGGRQPPVASEQGADAPRSPTRVKILDFGLARPMHEAAHLTQEGFTVGTPAYMSPEQARGEEVDARSDLFSLGCVLYRIATGERPFSGKNPAAVLLSMATVQPTRLRQLNPDVPPALEELVTQLLATDRANRPASARDVADRLQRMRQEMPLGVDRLSESAVGPADSRSWPTVAQQSARKRWLAAAAALLLLAAVGVLIPQIIIRIKGPDGKETEITAPGGSKVAIDEKGRVKIELPASQDKPAAAVHPLALVQQPARLKGLATWSIAPRSQPTGPTPIAYSPDGKWVYSGGVDGAVRMHAADTFSLRSVFLGHQGPVIHLAPSPDGNYLATTGIDHTVRLWEPETGKIARTIRCEGTAYSLAWSPNGKSLAGSNSVHTPATEALCIWDIGSKASQKTIKECHAQSVAWSPDGSRLAAGGWNKTVRIYDAESGKLLHTLQGHLSNVCQVAWSPRGKYLVSSGSDKTVRVWDADKGELLHTSKSHSDVAEALAWSPDGSTVALGALGRNKIRFLNPVTGIVTRTISCFAIHFLAWSPDGKTLLGSDAGGTLTFWDLGSGKEKHVIPGQSFYSVGGIHWSPRGDRFVISPLDRDAAIWKADTGQRVLTLERKHGGDKEAAAWSPDERRLALGSSECPEVQLWNSFNGTSLRKLDGHSRGILALAWSPDGKVLASAGKDKTVRLWDMHKYEVRHVLEGKGNANALAWSPDSKSVTAAGTDGTVHIWDAETGESRQRMPIPGDSEVLSLAWSPDDKLLASGIKDAIHLWNPNSGQLEDSLKDTSRPQEASFSAAWSPDGKLLISGGGFLEGGLRASIRTWDSGTGRLFHVIEENQGAVFGLALSRDGRSLLWGTQHGSSRLWDVQANQIRATFYTLADNRYLTVCANGHYLGSPGIEDQIVYVAVTEDGRQETLTPDEFARKYGWKNDPAKVKPLP